MLVALFLTSWALDALALLGVVRLSGTLELALYPLFIVAAASGWLTGNIYLRRSVSLPKKIRRRILVVYFVGPVGVLYLLWTLNTAELQSAAPFVPLYSFGVFTTFFLVPVSLRSSFRPRPKIRISRRATKTTDPP